MDKLVALILSPFREYRAAQRLHRRAVAEQEMIYRLLETGEPQRMPEEFVEEQKGEGRPIGIAPGPNFRRLLG